MSDIDMPLAHNAPTACRRMTEKMMTCIRLMLIAALLSQTISSPCAAQEAVVLKGDEVNESRLKTGMYVEVTYTFAGRRTEAKGYILSVWKYAFSVQDISLRTIAYGDAMALRIIPPEKTHVNTLEGK